MADPQHHLSYDVVVVGSGAGAMAGAHLAARAGLSTLVLEATDRLGGTTAYSGAAAWLPGSEVQRRAGVDDSTDSARAYLGALLGGREEEKREAFLATAPELVATLEADPALAFEFSAFPDYFDRPGRVPGGRSIVPAPLPLEEIGDLAALVRPPVERDRVGKSHHKAAPFVAGRALIGRFLLALTRAGGEVRTGHRVHGLVADGDRVVGVRAATVDGDVEVRARRGVLLAAGGFERDAAGRRTHVVSGEAAWTMAPEGTNTGDPLRAAVALGAATDLTDQAWWCPGLAMPDGSASFTLGFRGGFVVDQHGRRYGNESRPYDRFGRLMAQDPARIPSWVVFDSRYDALPAIAMPPGDPGAHLAAGTWHRADTLEGLAAAIGVPGEALVATAARFNGFAETGTDGDFGRGEDEYDRFWTDRVLVPVDRPPYTAARLVLSDLGTKGGLVTDVDGRVLRGDGSPIPGLYAAGNTSASMTGEVYPGPGIPIATAMVFASRAIAHLR